MTVKSRTKGRPVRTIEPDDDPVFSPVDLPATLPDVSPVEQDDGYEQWLRIQAELGEQEGKVVLKRRNARGQIGALGVVRSPEFSIERVIEDWGGGRYIAVVYDATGAKLGQVDFEVDEAVPQRTPRLALDERPTPGPGVADVARLMAPQTDPRIEALERMVTATNETVKTLVVAIANRPQQSMGQEVMGMALQFAQLLDKKSSPAVSFADLKDVFLAGLEARNAADAAEPEEGFMGVVKAFSPAIAKLVEKATGEQPMVVAGAAPALPPASVPVPVSPPPAPAPTAPATSGPAWLAALQPHLKAILKWAEEDRDADVYATVILDQMKPGQLAQLREEVKAPNFVPQTLAALPMFAPYSVWATNVLTNIKEMLTEEPGDTVEDGGDK